MGSCSVITCASPSIREVIPWCIYAEVQEGAHNPAFCSTGARESGTPVEGSSGHGMQSEGLLGQRGCRQLYAPQWKVERQESITVFPVLPLLSSGSHELSWIAQWLWWIHCWRSRLLMVITSRHPSQEESSENMFPKYWWTRSWTPLIAIIRTLYHAQIARITLQLMRVFLPFRFLFVADWMDCLTCSVTYHAATEIFEAPLLAAGVNL